MKDRAYEEPLCFLIDSLNEECMPKEIAVMSGESMGFPGECFHPEHLRSIGEVWILKGKEVVEKVRDSEYDPIMLYKLAIGYIAEKILSRNPLLSYCQNGGQGRRVRASKFLAERKILQLFKEVLTPAN